MVIKFKRNIKKITLYYSTYQIIHSDISELSASRFSLVLSSKCFWVSIRKALLTLLVNIATNE